MRILLVYPRFPDTFWSFQYALDFIGKKASSPPLGLVTVAALLPEAWEKRLVDMNVTPLQDADLQWADMVFLSAMAVQRKSVDKVIARCNQLGAKVVAGGPLFTEEYERFDGVDHFVLNEAELTLAPFLSNLEQGTPQRVYRTDQFADMSLTPVPLWELVDHRKYDSMAIQFSRGCPFNCDFCNVTALLGHRVRTKSAQQITAELDKIYSMGWRRNVFFVDDNFIGNRKLIKEEILPALIDWRKDKIGCFFITEASINLSDDEALMDLMVRAGFKSVFVGIETPDEVCLEECRKSQNRGRNLVESVKSLQRAGLQVMGGFIVGFDSDTESIFQRQIDFIQKSGIVTAMVGLLQAPYGTKLYQRLADEGRLLGRMSGDNVDGETNIVPRMDLLMLKEGYRNILEKIYEPEPFYQRVRTFLWDYNNSHNVGSLEWVEIKALFRTIFRLGILGRERREYWKLLLWTLWHFPSKLPQAITFSVYGYHFRTMMERHVAPVS